MDAHADEQRKGKDYLVMMRLRFKHFMKQSRNMDVILKIQNISQATEKLLTTNIGSMRLNCGEVIISSQEMLYARVSTVRGENCKNMIISANMKIRFGVLMNRTDRTNDGHVLHVRIHYSNGQTRTHP